MSLNLSIVCHDRGFSQEGEPEKVARVIGEILPFILAKYGVDAPASKRNQGPDSRDERLSPRFQK